MKSAEMQHRRGGRFSVSSSVARGYDGGGDDDDVDIYYRKSYKPDSKLYFGMSPAVAILVVISVTAFLIAPLILVASNDGILARSDSAQRRSSDALSLSEEVFHDRYDKSDPLPGEKKNPKLRRPSASNSPPDHSHEDEDEDEVEERARLAMQEKLTFHPTDSLDGVSHHDGPPLGYIRVPKFSVPVSKRNEDDGKLHIIFSSGCNYFQHWQSELLLASAYWVGQRGRITRLVSGCHDKTAETVAHSHQTFPSGKNDLLVPLKDLNRSVNENFGLYVTPSFKGAKDFPWINKPSSIEYFMKHAAPELERAGETVIAILDPDFIFLKSMTQSELPSSDVLTSGSRKPKRGMNVVRKGRPVAQRYGIGGGWVHRFPVKKIAGADSHALTYSSSSAAHSFSVGPPLMLHIDDAKELSTLWSKYMRPVLKIDNDILADMWAYSMAAAHLDLEHEILDQYMVSTWCSHSGCKGQGWPWLDPWFEEPLKCTDPAVPAGAKLPNFIHLASNFKAPDNKEWMFHKGHVPPDILSCDTPFIIESPDNIVDVSKSFKTKVSGWVLCHTVRALNRLLREYKEKFCKSGYEKRYLVKLIQSKRKDRHCSERKNKWCYPLAQIDGLPDDWRTRGPDAGDKIQYPST